MGGGFSRKAIAYDPPSVGDVLHPASDSLSSFNEFDHPGTLLNEFLVNALSIGSGSDDLRIIFSNKMFVMAIEDYISSLMCLGTDTDNEEFYSSLLKSLEINIKSDQFLEDSFNMRKFSYVLQQFLHSESYCDWREKQSLEVSDFMDDFQQQATEAINMSNFALSNQEKLVEPAKSKNNQVFYSPDPLALYCVQQLRDGPIKDVLGIMNDSNILDILSKDLWLFDFICSVENIPISITIATIASDKHRHYPLIYVNKHYEVMSKYSRYEIIGKDLSYTTNEDHLSSSVSDCFSYDIEHHQVHKTTYSSICKDGEIFQNYICSKPILNEKNECAYIISLQLNDVDPLDKPSPYNLADKLIGFLPTRIHNYTHKYVI